jgi:hypothetical protein
VAAVAALLFGLVHTPVLSLSCGIMLAFFGIGVDPVIKIYGAEQYPTRIRETGIGLFEGVGRFFGGALAPLHHGLAARRKRGARFLPLRCPPGPGGRASASLPSSAQKPKDEASNTPRRYQDRAKHLL